MCSYFFTSLPRSNYIVITFILKVMALIAFAKMLKEFISDYFYAT